LLKEHKPCIKTPSEIFGESRGKLILLYFLLIKDPLLLQGMEQAAVLIGDVFNQLGDFQMQVLDLGVIRVVRPLQMAEPH
jgi:hypothetical protein